MFFKKIKKTFIMVLTSFIMPISIFAYSDYIIAGGENVGIEIKSKGVMVVGLYEIDGKYKASDAGLAVGDMIVSINKTSVSTIEEMTNIIANCTDTIQVGFIRNGKLDYTNLELTKDENDVFKTGLYVKDTIKGIGTLTFIDPSTKYFGALGHEIIEKSTGQILEVKDGHIFDSTVTNIEPSRNGVPGEKNAVFGNNVKGTITENTNKGIFGTYNEIPDKKLYKVANVNDVQKGSAKILTVLSNQEIKEYDINILKIQESKDNTKNLLFEITDKNILEQTGGIVQGMSGSPIIQNDYIIGAVTHVVVDSPNKGYGILITNMLEEAEN
ncbi:MAG: SpoIVB peptidase [Bacilli bacterium]|nr:SpoIVB peptidase [Bacilli bacterium]